jgi:hypothetical protein
MAAHRGRREERWASWSAQKVPIHELWMRKIIGNINDPDYIIVY